MSVPRPKAIIFDVFGTVVDWRTGVANECTKVFGKFDIDFDPLEFADLWRGEYQPAMERIRSGNRGYVSLDTLHRENLDRVLEKTGLAGYFDEASRQALNHAWEKLPPWPDSVAGLQKMKANFIIAPCSNGSIALMARLAKFGQLPWDAIVGADIAKAYKPAPEAYLLSCDALALPPEDVLMVAAHNDDLVAARSCGLQTAFIHRTTEHGPDQTTDLQPEADWDYVSQNLETLSHDLAVAKNS